MWRNTVPRLGLFSVLKEELQKVIPYMSYQVKNSDKLSVEGLSQAVDFLKGENKEESPEMQERRKKHKEVYHEILRQKEAKEKEAMRQKYAPLTYKQKLSALWDDIKAACSPQAGAMALLQQCTASHAAEVAIEQGIDVKNVQMVLEKQTQGEGLEEHSVVVGYIDAPAASEEEVMAFAEKLHKACPAANTMHIEWRHGNSDEYGKKEPLNKASTSGARPSVVEEPIPMGMPGTREHKPLRHETYRAPLSRDDDELHLPGVKRPKTKNDGSDGKL
ncbi:hypothetical protein AGDE_02586 [Angomonas deanei]|nr:hypothetical protein AGDE_11735 [Angomonas deanei]EPY39831.1 hypothetical protein AGDE_04097 [Angomonas deanei]EPY41339.1 hypothetical protein AGDE_02586 [Angomonas deanei]|eukprot:EPY25472.1 hypothetical protein AGDE_11735 [Angomonas deanei]